MTSTITLTTEQLAALLESARSKDIHLDGLSPTPHIAPAHLQWQQPMSQDKRYVADFPDYDNSGYPLPAYHKGRSIPGLPTFHQQQCFPQDNMARQVRYSPCSYPNAQGHTYPSPAQQTRASLDYIAYEAALRHQYRPPAGALPHARRPDAFRFDGNPQPVFPIPAAPAPCDWYPAGPRPANSASTQSTTTATTTVPASSTDQPGSTNNTTASVTVPTNPHSVTATTSAAESRVPAPISTAIAFDLATYLNDPSFLLSSTLSAAPSVPRLGAIEPIQID
ncbi:hypothetical protein A4X13_0g4454 [Tilletia indica]|uniref:Uncharacterized protein n=1 Tax=Tilletia indica TaxID=43049 RepID=A0A177TNV9_9BASI|nr:hypothetical protein A4X13_0g4454 [Tilletia indica]